MPVFTSPQIRVSVNNQQRATVRTIGISPEKELKNLADLNDVDATDPDNNETLVYNSTTGKYVIKVLPSIDGGSY